jgi:glycosyltransferase involved in cell wall biosynthesis
MKIALFHNLPSGGAKRSLYDQIHHLDKKHTFDVYTLSTADHEFGDIRPFVESYTIYEFKPSRLMRSPWGRLNQAIRISNLYELRTIMKKIAHHIDSQDYDLVFVHPCQYTNSPGLLRFLNTPSLFYCHEILRLVYDPPIRHEIPISFRSLLDKIDPMPGIYRDLLASEDRQNLFAAGSVLVNSKYSQNRFNQIYGIQTKLCYHGVNTNLFTPLGLKRSGFVISVGALRPDKGFDFIINSLGIIPKNIRPDFLIVTNYLDNSEKAYLESLASHKGVSLTIEHAISDRQLVQRYNLAAITLYAPISEPFGLVPIESMACGTPVIGVAEGGVLETIVHEQTGLLLDRKPDAFADAIIELMENVNRRNEYSAQAREYVCQNWTWDNATKKLEQYFKEAVN